MTDDRPEPKYGQYAPVPPAPVAEPPAVQPVPTVATPRRTWDVVLTTALLLFGVFDVVTGFSQFSHLADTLAAAYTAQGFGDFSSDALANSMGVGINVARVVILAVTVIAALVRIRSRKLAFWIPLVGAAASGLVVIACILAVIIQDPAFAAYVAQQSATP